MGISYKQFENKIIEYTLKNNNGMTVKVINIGCSITEILVPDKHGEFHNVVLRNEYLDGYFENGNFFGAVVAPIAGRVENAEFTIGDDNYSFKANQGNHLLHSGNLNLYNKIWKSSVEEEKVVFQYKMGTEFPGRPLIRVMYSLSDDNELKLEYEVDAVSASVVAPTNHTYFNLSNDLTEDVSNHAIKADVKSFLKMDEDLIPISAEEPAGVFDLNEGKVFGDVFKSEDTQMKIANDGFDHYFIFNKNNRAVEVSDERSGRTLKVTTSFPGMVLYTGNNLNENTDLKDRQPQKHAGFCLETQESPAALKIPLGFDVRINGNEIYKRQTVFSFGVNK
ncbi:aldose epimerase family protein [Salinicoccus sp. HZC-1]|uniref:aldose epimerase family protein n=1 Tax=Salinicoccus sp. HZC-1 TaxID=3385497 RepID=UPI00398BAB2B